MEIGEKYKLFYNEGNPNNKIIYIRAIVDKEWVVYKERIGNSMSKTWQYHIEHTTYFDLLKKKGVIEKNE